MRQIEMDKVRAKGKYARDYVRQYDAASEASHAKWDREYNTDDNYTLVFDGEQLSLFNKNQRERSWKAVSGLEGYQDKAFQDQKNKGPLPEGVYMMPQDRYQEMSKKDLYYGMLRRGTWPGGIKSWGAQRVWLDPAIGTNTFGRSGCAAHGGTEPGSRGCIDLTTRMPSFAKWFKSYGKDVPLVVKYPD